MRRSEHARQKAIKEISFHSWNTMWQVFCPWVAGGDIAPLQPQLIQPSRRAKNKTRKSLAGFMVGVALLALTAAPSNASTDRAAVEGKVILAALNERVPGDSASAMNMDVFGNNGTRYSDIGPFTKWTGVLTRFKKDFPKNMDKPEVKAWLTFLGTLKDASDERKIQAVNDYMNRVPFIEDTKNYGRNDHWATPMEFLRRGGDCEDYAIAKYISLRALGVPQHKMRLAIVYDRVMRMPHALLAVAERGETEILDNQNPAVISSSDITRYKPIYSISQVAWWRH
jgi:predicted transglutaminase-like cysteine proteinase